ncbi:MAG: methyltransferase [Candidatus Marinimicrobia bacterium]|jgi:16S rRNA (guanine966-N2)-methyltransferase|nr:methyltransferase [Candidatus Neomarinimicrobiota bacterium]MBT5955725.1 methyltransferase [Candidatus Neomarinimicrobiota bacterium]MBT7377146.1 methyltransferase [Candidatus Neomarinimicrobiota bacterium]|tara:strand:- start:6574 stop:7095 length:522 start_codon:yes stop_codon:yes gene_type:complete
MIKIISGKYKGRKLQDVPNLYVRPTQAVVRKSMMQILEPFDGASVLDLYAGVGTLGLEALSRGASQLTSVESNRLVLETLKKNIAIICKDEDITIKAMDVSRFLKMNLKKYDVIIADPPYTKVDYLELKEKIKPFLKDDGIFCMEMKRCLIDDDTARIKKYGSTQVVFWRAEA